MILAMTWAEDLIKVALIILRVIFNHSETDFTLMLLAREV